MNSTDHTLQILQLISKTKYDSSFSLKEFDSHIKFLKRNSYHFEHRIITSDDMLVSDAAQFNFFTKILPAINKSINKERMEKTIEYMNTHDSSSSGTFEPKIDDFIPYITDYKDFFTKVSQETPHFKFTDLEKVLIIKSFVNFNKIFPAFNLTHNFDIDVKDKFELEKAKKLRLMSATEDAEPHLRFGFSNEIASIIKDKNRDHFVNKIEINRAISELNVAHSVFDFPKLDPLYFLNHVEEVFKSYYEDSPFLNKIDFEKIKSFCSYIYNERCCLNVKFDFIEKLHKAFDLFEQGDDEPFFNTFKTHKKIFSYLDMYYSNNVKDVNKCIGNLSQNGRKLIHPDMMHNKIFEFYGKLENSSFEKMLFLSNYFSSFSLHMSLGNTSRIDPNNFFPVFCLFHELDKLKLRIGKFFIQNPEKFDNTQGYTGIPITVLLCRIQNEEKFTLVKQFKQEHLNIIDQSQNNSFFEAFWHTITDNTYLHNLLCDYSKIAPYLQNNNNNNLRAKAIEKTDMLKNFIFDELNKKYTDDLSLDFLKYSPFKEQHIKPLVVNTICPPSLGLLLNKSALKSLKLPQTYSRNQEIGFEQLFKKEPHGALFRDYIPILQEYRMKQLLNANENNIKRTSKRAKI